METHLSYWASGDRRVVIENHKHARFGLLSGQLNNNNCLCYVSSRFGLEIFDMLESNIFL